MTDNLTLNMDAYLPLRDVVFNTLREAILKGELKPGERLMELQLASKLGVSRTPIREAIRMLEQEGLAVTMPRKGAEVAKMTLKDMEDVLEVREALDELAAKIACKKISDEQLANLKTIKDEFKRSMDSGDVKKIAEEDVKFHDAIYEATNNAKLVSMMNNIREQMYRYRVEYWTDKGNADSDTLDFLSKLKNKKIFLFGTAGFGGSDAYFQRILGNVKSTIDSSNTIVGEYMCQGKMPQSVRERYVKMKENPEHPDNIDALIENFDKALSHPDSDDLERLKNIII